MSRREASPADPPSARPVEAGDPAAAEKPPARADLRLLLPAATGWVVQALLLGADGGWRLACGGLAVGVTAAAVVHHHRRRRGGRPAPPLRAGDARSSARPDPSPGSDDGRSARPVPSRGAGDATSYAALLALTGLVVLLVTGALIAWTAVRDAGPVAELARERAVVTARAGVAGDPHLVAGGRGGPPLVAVVVDLHEVTGRGTTTSVHDPVLVLGDTSLLALRWRSEVLLTGRLGPTDDPADDVVALLAPHGPVRVVSEPGAVERVAELVRGRFEAATGHLPADARGLLPGLVLGDTTRSPQDLTAAMQASGLTHLSAVSGSNVTIVLAAGIWLCGWLGVRRRRRPLVALALLVVFVVLVRPEPSVLRAAAMGCVGLLGLSTHRRQEGLPAVAAAVAVLLVWDPWLSRSVGFALSTLATVGLLVLARPWGEALAARLPPRLRWLGPAVGVPLAAQVVCGPVVVVLQGSVSLVAVLTNLLAAPLVTPATVLGVAVALVALAAPPLAAWLAWLPALPTLGIALVGRTGAGLPWGSIPWPTGAGGALTLAALSLLVVLTGPWLLHHARHRPAVTAACVVLGLAVGAPTGRLTWPPPGWRYVLCDVGQGDGMVLRSAAGAVVVVDAGPDPGAVDGCLARLGVTRVDAVVLTHDHADHVDGLTGVLHGRTVGALLVDPVDEPADRAGDVVAEARAARVPVTRVWAGDRLAWPGISARVWWPARVIRAGSVPNNASVVLTVDVDGLRLLLLGDVEREAAAEVLRALRADPAALVDGFDVVKVAHHGSANRDDQLYAAAHAPLAVVSVGADNDYGHPAPSTVSTLRGDGFEVLRTDLSGDIAVVGDHAGLRYVTAR